MFIGVSIVICCYNSVKRLPQTLAHLAAQKITQEILWEVIVIDNASSDDTAKVAKTVWESESSIPLRVVYEPQPGLSHARHRGFTEATYDIVSFVDDDNWVCSEWVQTVAEIMSQHPQVGACGGFNEAVSEVNLPWWFERYQQNYAVGSQAQQVGDITQNPGILWGAGLTVRKQAWQQLLNQGFQSILTDRKGTALSSCGDYEFCIALRAAGWRLWYEPRLLLRHCLPASRLQWSYLRRLNRGNGASSVGLDPYFNLSSANYLGFRSHLMRNWYCRMAIVLIKLLRYPHKLLLSRYQWEGDPEILYVETLLGRLSELIRRRRVYELNIKTVSEASWRVTTDNSQY